MTDNHVVEKALIDTDDEDKDMDQDQGELNTAKPDLIEATLEEEKNADANPERWLNF
jgi:hypothetical protein